MSFMKPQIVRLKTYHYIWRLSAPGYPDCTDWSITAKTLYETIKDILETHGNEFDLEDFQILECYLETGKDIMTEKEYHDLIDAISELHELNQDLNYNNQNTTRDGPQPSKI